MESDGARRARVGGPGHTHRRLVRARCGSRPGRVLGLRSPGHGAARRRRRSARTSSRLHGDRAPTLACGRSSLGPADVPCLMLAAMDAFVPRGSRGLTWRWSRPRRRGCGDRRRRHSAGGHRGRLESPASLASRSGRGMGAGRTRGVGARSPALPGRRDRQLVQSRHHHRSGARQLRIGRV
jgi:hypothetical protein